MTCSQQNIEPDLSTSFLNSVAILLDYWHNSEASFDAAAGPNHVEIQTNGNFIYNRLAPIPYPLATNTIRYVWIDYANNLLNIYLSGSPTKPSVPTLSDNINIGAYLQNSEGYIGFTSSNGSSAGEHFIYDFAFQNNIDEILVSDFTDGTFHAVGEAVLSSDQLKLLKIQNQINGYAISKCSFELSEFSINFKYRTNGAGDGFGIFFKKIKGTPFPEQVLGGTIGYKTDNLNLCGDKLNQSIIFNIQNDINLLSRSIALTASSTSNLPVSYTISDSSIAEIRNNNILFLKQPGVITITANQIGNNCYFSAQPVSRTVTITSSICDNLNFLDCKQGINKQIKTNVPEEIKELVIETNPPYCMSGSLDLNSFSNLEKFECRYTQLTGIQNYGNKNKLINFDISNNYFKNTLENVQSNELKTFNIRHNEFDGSIFDLSNKNQLEYFNCSNNKLSSYNGISIPNKLKEFYAADNQLNAASVSNIIMQFKNMVETYNVFGGNLYLDGPTNSPPNLDSFLASGFLKSKNWLVKCNPKGYGGDGGGGNILNLTVGALNQTVRNLNIRSLFSSSFSSPQQVYITIYGNVGSSLSASNNEPSIRVGDWPVGTKIILENAGPVSPAGCNPTNGVIAGRGGGTCGPNGIYSVTDAIWIDSQVELLIINNGIIGGGGAAGADNPNGCGEGGGGAGIPAGNVGLGGGQNTCCVGESPGTTLCGGSVSNFQNPKSNKGGDLGQDGGTIASSNPRPGYAIRKIAGASYTIAPWSSNPTFAGLGLIGDL